MHAGFAQRMGPDHFELTMEQAVRRGTACINVRWEDKVIFDAIQTWASRRKGRNVSQWDAFSMILAAALANESSELALVQL